MDRLYVYGCEGCGLRFEKAHRVSECDAVHPCPHCHSSRTHRIPQAFVVNWNGLKPSAGGYSPAVADLLDPDSIAARRDAYAAKKAARGESWP